ncbi:hypothetical protein PMIN03_006820 [Paraphaeosphaeria minitans]
MNFTVFCGGLIWLVVGGSTHERFVGYPGAKSGLLPSFYRPSKVPPQPNAHILPLEFGTDHHVLRAAVGGELGVCWQSPKLPSLEVAPCTG